MKKEAVLLKDEDLEEVNGGWISAEELSKNRNKYVGKTYTLSKAGYWFGIHEDLYRVELLNVFDLQERLMVSYKILEVFPDKVFGTYNVTCYKEGDIIIEEYSKSTNNFLR